MLSDSDVFLCFHESVFVCVVNSVCKGSYIYIYILKKGHTLSSGYRSHTGQMEVWVAWEKRAKCLWGKELRGISSIR